MYTVNALFFYKSNYGEIFSINNVLHIHFAICNKIGNHVGIMTRTNENIFATVQVIVSHCSHHSVELEQKFLVKGNGKQ